MNRPAPRYRPQEILARAVFQPAGGRQLEIVARGNMVSMVFDEDQVPQLERAIARFREAVAFEDGRGDRAVDRAKSIPLETS